MLLANISILLLEITNAERDKARKKYESQREMVKETVAFGRHVDGTPKKVYTPPPSGTFESFGFDSGRCAFYPKTLYACRQTMPACLNRQLRGQNRGIATSKALVFFLVFYFFFKALHVKKKPRLVFVLLH